MPRRLPATLILLLAAAALPAQEPLILKELGGWVGAVAFTPDSARLAVGTSDGSIGIFDAISGERVQSTNHNRDAVIALAYGPDGKRLISLDQSKSGRSVAVATKSSSHFIGRIDGTIAVMPENGAPFEKRGHRSWVNGLALSPNDTVLASAGSDNTVRLWRAKDLEPLQTFHVSEGEVRCVAFSPDGKLVAAGIRYGGLRVWDVASKKEVASLRAHEGETWAVAFTPDGKLLASGGGDWNKPGEVRFWDTATWKERATLKHSGEVLCLAISRDGRRFAAGSWDRTVRVWSLPTVGK